MAKQTNSLAHTKWMCKYHIIFTPKYRRKIVYNQYKADLRDILKQLCSYKGVEIIEGHLMNRLPKFGGDDGRWVYDRIMVVECLNVIAPEEQDKELLDKMYAEREGME